ncbi:hypothetical protein [Pandoraea faecigallinarum]|uniref:hypothetical protein n=1 Tax=Pandoraea faecigallinarum TaxID=656179 RepID=UPI0012F4800A|nr:hypothetical protein [Pandoraea faecigallinarum]
MNEVNEIGKIGRNGRNGRNERNGQMQTTGEIAATPRFANTVDLRRTDMMEAAAMLRTG